MNSGILEALKPQIPRKLTETGDRFLPDSVVGMFLLLYTLHPTTHPILLVYEHAEYNQISRLDSSLFSF